MDRAAFLSEYCDRDQAWMRRIADHQETLPKVRWSEVTSIVFNYRLFEPGSRFGWVTDEGDWLPCGHAGHEKLLEMIGHDVEIDERNWVRVSMAKVQAYSRLTDAQVKTLLRLSEEGVLMPGAAANLSGLLFKKS